MTHGHQLRFFNSLGRQIEDFVPSAEPSGMYSCGPTVYAFPHLGNMRAYVSADTVRRALRSLERRGLITLDRYVFDAEPIINGWGSTEIKWSSKDRTSHSQR